jgi:two-component system, cell cycle response regulator DivK
MADKSILIIDTNKDQIQKITSMLGAEGYACFSALAGEAGIDLAKKTNPALIFINAAISAGMRGLEICKTIHEMNELNDVPIIILTPRKVIITKRDSDLYGIVDFLSYAFTEGELISKTKDFLSRFLAEKKSEEQIPADEQHAEHISDSEQSEQPLDQHAAVQTDLPELQPSDAGIFDQVFEDTQEKGPDTVSKEREEIKIESAVSQEGATEAGLTIPPLPEDEPVSEDQQKSTRKPIFMVSLFIILIVITAGVILFYEDISDLPLFQKSRPELIQPPVPAEQPAVTLPSSNELQKPQQGEEGAAPPVNGQPKPQPVEEKKAQVPQEKQKAEVTKKATPVLPPTPLPEEKSDKKETYSVQIGVFKNEANANSLAIKFDSKGYHARVHTGKAKDQSPIYRVLIGKFRNDKDAKQHAEKIHSGENIPVILYKE